MRIFIAINFDEQLKNKIQEVISKLKTYSTQGRFVNKEHLHITLEFLGEIEPDRVEVIKSLMDDLSIKPFSLRLEGIGYFKRREGNIYWIGIEKNQDIINAHSKLHNKLRNEGFKLENRQYTPHLTLGRKVIVNRDIDNISDTLKGQLIEVKSIDLMKSEHINDKLTYTKIHSKKLKEDKQLLL